MMGIKCFLFGHRIERIPFAYQHDPIKNKLTGQLHRCKGCQAIVTMPTKVKLSILGVAKK